MCRPARPGSPAVLASRPARALRGAATDGRPGVIRLDLLPAKDGDSLLVTYGDQRRTRHLLIDGGRASSYPMIKPVLASIGEPLDLLVVTHVDQDHILGVLAMFKDPDRAQFKDV